MKYELCPDDNTLKVNGSGELYADLDSTYFDLTSEGYAFENALGYVRQMPDSMVDLYTSGGGVTWGDSVKKGMWTYLRSDYEPPLEDGYPVFYYLNFFTVKVVLGAGFNLGSGTLNWILVPSTPMAWDVTVKLTDVSAGTVRYGTIKDRAMVQNNVTVTATSPWTWAVGDTIELSGSAIAAEVAFDPF